MPSPYQPATTKQMAAPEKPQRKLIRVTTGDHK